MNEAIDKPDVYFRTTTARDGARMWSFVKEHGVLELNSAYCYMLMAEHFGHTCLVAERKREDGTRDLAGFVLAHRPPRHDEDLFVWQIGVHPDMRGRGLAKRMITELLGQPGARGVMYVTATVATDNEPSRALFRGFARDVDVSCEESEFFTPDMFPSENGAQHAAEDLFRIGPLNSAGATENLDPKLEKQT